MLVFDSDLHGYDPVVGGVGWSVHGEREEHTEPLRIEPLTIEPVSRPVTVDMVTNHPDDLFDEDFDEFAERRSDMFDWIWIVFDGRWKDPDSSMEFECA
ncbi:MAG: hypothetical protein AAF192_17725 [Pseudomonadota bacterium]